MNMLLSGPIIAALFLLEQFIPAIVFMVLVVHWSSLADVDVYINKYDAFNFRSAKIRHTPYVVLVSIALRLNNLASRVSSRVKYIDRTGYSVSHRGITHTIWFAISVGVMATLLAAVLTGIAVAGIVYAGYEQQGLELLGSAMEFGHPAVFFFSIFLAGFLSIIYHSLGDIVTPSGVGFLQADESISLDRFRFDNEFANRSVLLFGNISILCGIGAPLLYIAGEIPLLFVIGGLVSIYFVFFPMWLILPRTRVGDWIIYIYDGLMK